jgi:lysozyme
MEKTNSNFIDELKQRIIQHEGKVNKCYLDHLGNATIGIGHLVTMDDQIDVNKEYDDEFIMQLFEKDFDIAFKGATRLCQDMKMEDEKFGVFVELAYWIGVNGLSKFRKTLQHAKNNEWNKCADELLNSKLARQVPGRSQALANIMRGK